MSKRINSRNEFRGDLAISREIGYEKRAAGRRVEDDTVSNKTRSDFVVSRCFPVVREEDGGRVGALKRGLTLAADG